MTYDRTRTELSEFGDRLDAYGADIKRWPQMEQARAAALLDGDARARRLLAEARALDAVLARAPLLAPGRQTALADRILAQVEAHARGAAVARGAADDVRGKVIPWPRAARRGAAGMAGAARRSSWQAAALLAASLAVGVFVGTQDLAPTAVEQLVAAVDVDANDDAAAVLIGGDGLAAAIDEDFL